MADYSFCNVDQNGTKPYLFPFTLIEDSQVKRWLKPDAVGVVSIQCYFIAVGW